MITKKDITFKKDYELIFVYGLSEERPLILLTNRSIKSKPFPILRASGKGVFL